MFQVVKAVAKKYQAEAENESPDTIKTLTHQMFAELEHLFGEYQRAGHRAEIAVFLNCQTKTRIIDASDASAVDSSFYNAPICISIDRRLAGDVVMVLLNRVVKEVEQAIDCTAAFGNIGYAEPPAPEIGEDEIPF